MMNTKIDYKKIINIPRIENNILVLNFDKVEFLHTFEITELFTFIVLLPFEGENYEIKNETVAVFYLYRINFFEQLEKVKNLSPQHSQNPYEAKSERLLELQTYKFKSEFYGNAEKLVQMFLNRGLSEDTSYNLLASFAEVVDNVFLHNLGKWTLDTEFRCLSLVQDYPKWKKLLVSICDFGVGFYETLHSNYPEIKDESDAISLGIRKATTARNPQKGGNGLILLQKNVFNGFNGELFIRSKNVLAKISQEEKLEIINKEIPFNHGSSVSFLINF